MVGAPVIDWAAFSNHERNAVDDAVTNIHETLLVKLHESAGTPLFMGIHAAVQVIAVERDRSIDDLAARGALYERLVEEQKGRA